MKKLKLTIELLPKGAWERDLSKTLSKKDWDVLRNHCYERANQCCEICGAKCENYMHMKNGNLILKIELKH